MRLGSMLHWKVPLAAKVKSARSQERHGLIESLGRTVGRGYGQDDAQVGGVLICLPGEDIWGSKLREHDGCGHSGVLRRAVMGICAAVTILKTPIVMPT